jgi:hypothetical protein
MAAGQGFKTFTTGEVLTAADVNGYLMQGVGVFTDAANRDAEITSPQEGQFAYLKDTNVTTYYTGSAWANLDTTGMTNPMTTTGDTIYSSSGSTPARLGIGSTGQVLTVSGGVPTWATASSGGMTLIGEAVLSASTGYSFSSIPSTYKQLVLIWSGIRHSANGAEFAIRLNANSSAVYQQAQQYTNNSAVSVDHQARSQVNTSSITPFGYSCKSADIYLVAQGIFTIDNYASTTKTKVYETSFSYYDDEAGANKYANLIGTFSSTSAVTSVDITRLYGTATISNIANTTVRLYGVS